MIQSPSIPQEDQLFIDRLRGLSIMRVVLVHLGLSWFYTPYSQFVHAFLPVLFFVSGAVSYFSFLRAETVFHYVTKRLLGVLGPYYVIVAGVFLFYWGLQAQLPSISLNSVVDWLVVNPSIDEMPYPMGQIWFLRALALITIISLPAFYFSRVHQPALLYPVLLSLLLASLQQITNIHEYFVIWDFNLFQALTSIGFFFFGAIYYSYKKVFSRPVLIALLFIALCVPAFLLIYGETALNMADHTYSPDIYYVSSSLAAIILVLLFTRPISSLLNNVTTIDRFILFVSKHAYSIFILHSLIIVASEKWFGLTGVHGNLLLATLKILFVIFGTCLLAVPTTYVSKKFTSNVQRFIQKRTARRHHPVSGI